MARAWITDLWVKDAVLELADGSAVKVQPTPAQLKSITKLPEQFRSSRFGRGKRWKVGWYETGPRGERIARSKLFEQKRGAGGAEEFMASLEEDIRVGRYLKPEDRDRLFSEAAALWLESKRKVKGSTRDSYERWLRTYVLPRWSGHRVGSITRPEIVKWVTALMVGTAPVKFDRRKSETAKALGAPTIKLIVADVFGAILRYAVSEKWIPESPVVGVELPEIKKRARRATLTHDQVEEMALACQKVTGEYRDYVAVQMLVYSAPRINELFALQALHAHGDDARLDIDQAWMTLESAPGRRALDLPKGNEPRTVPLVSHTIPMLDALTKDLGGDAFIFRQAGTIEALEYGWWMANVWHPAAEASKLDAAFPKFTPHLLRHTGITFAIAAGADVKVIQAMAGHKNIQITLDVYGHLLPDRLKDVALAMEALRKKALTPKLVALPRPS